jgi:hypothetical protein
MAKLYHLRIETGATYPSRTLEYNRPDGTDFSLTGFTAQLQVRTSATAPTAVLTTTPVVVAASGLVSFAFTATQTALLTAPTYVYAIELTNSTTGEVIRLVEGDIHTSPEVVR